MPIILSDRSRPGQEWSELTRVAKLPSRNVDIKLFLAIPGRHPDSPSLSPRHSDDKVASVKLYMESLQCNKEMEISYFAFL